MKEIYIVTYLIVQMVMTGCPDANKPDKFGIIKSSNISCAAMHWRTEKEKVEKEFDNEADALLFFNEAKDYNKKEQELSFLIGNTKIDSVTIKKVLK